MQRGKRRALSGLILLGLACRALIPVGYMPAPLTAGGPVVLCPGDFSIALLNLPGVRGAHHHNHHGSQDSRGAGHTAWDACAFAAASAAFLPVAEYATAALVFEQVPPPAAPAAVAPYLPAASYSARAPPVRSVRA
jgi:hypothetical protein